MSNEEMEIMLNEKIEALQKLDGLKIELCGCWLWITGETKKHKEALKANQCRWARKKMKWYFAGKPSGGRKAMDMSYIRTKYGSAIVKDETA